VVRDYVFLDEWRIAAEPDRVWGLVRRVEGWSDWWPSVRRVDRLDGPGDAGPEAWRFTFQTRLPYAIIFETAIVTEDPLAVEVLVTGRLEGTGSYGVRTIDGGTLVYFMWHVSPQLPWMRLMSPLARPIFAWNHRALMVEGGEALALRMGTRLLRPVVSELRRDHPSAP
jgi:hypothetical protein